MHPRLRETLGIGACATLLACSASSPQKPDDSPTVATSARLSRPGMGTFAFSGAARGSVASDSFSAAFPGTCKGEYRVDASGTMTLERLSITLDREQTLRSSGFLGIGATSYTFSKGIVYSITKPSSLLTAAGGSTGAELYSFAPGSMGASATVQVLHDGETTREGYTAIYNSTAVTGTADPNGGRFTLAGAFRSGSNTINVSCVGGYDNRPPTSRIGVSPFLGQISGCPAQLDAKKRMVVEANAPSATAGRVSYRAYVRWLSFDPDGAGSGSGIVEESGFWNGAPFTPPASTSTFESGVTHTLQLFDADTYGARSSDRCSFEVVDTTPPAVVAPGGTVIECSQRGGALASLLPSGWLTSATATDVASTPVTLPAQIGGVDVGPTTFLPLGSTNVTFRAKDSSGNVGTASAAVVVKDRLAPTGIVTPSVSSIAAAKASTVTVTLKVTASDPNDCSPVNVSLLSVGSNDPIRDTADITNASVGTADYDVTLARALTTTGQKRVYTLRYALSDASGNSAVASTTVTITP